MFWLLFTFHWLQTWRGVFFCNGFTSSVHKSFLTVLFNYSRVSTSFGVVTHRSDYNRRTLIIKKCTVYNRRTLIIISMACLLSIVEEVEPWGGGVVTSLPTSYLWSLRVRPYVTHLRNSSYSFSSDPSSSYLNKKSIAKSSTNLIAWDLSLSEHQWYYRKFIFYTHLKFLKVIYSYNPNIEVT